MSIIALGINHASAPVSVRERVSVSRDAMVPALEALRAVPGVLGAAILSTCNRTDLYCRTVERADPPLLEWFRDVHGLGAGTLAPHLYRHHAASAVRHVMRVASGLDSLVLGEPQILGQLKQAHADAAGAGTLDNVLDRLFQRSFSVAKEVRTQTRIGASPVSVAFAAVTLARRVFDALDRRTALVLGAGETCELAVRHLRAAGLGRLIVANRTLANAHALARAHDGFAIGLDEIGAHLAEADIVIASTASPTAVIDAASVRAASATRRRRPVLMIDLAVPHDVDPAVADLDDVYLYTVDDLGDVIEEGRRARRAAANEAETIVDVHVDAFMGWVGTLGVTDAICSVRERAERERAEVLARAKARLARGEDAGAVLDYLAHTLTNRILHEPTVGIRRAGANARLDLVDAALTLFAVEPGDGARAGQPDPADPGE